MLGFLTHLVDFSRRHAWPVLATALLLAIICGWYTSQTLGINTDTSALLSPNLPWQQQSRAFDKAFPQGIENTTIVIDGTDAGQVELGTAKLAQALAKRTDMFSNVRRPDSGPFFNTYGLMFLSARELGKLSDQLAEAQPLLGPLDADPSLRGLFGVLNTALTGIEGGEAAAQKLAKPMTAFATTVASVNAGTPKPVAWSEMMTGRKPLPEELRHFILVQPHLDYSSVEPGSTASAAIREEARKLGLAEMGLRVRLTGDVPLEDDEFASVSEGAGVATALSLGGILVVLLIGLRAPKLIAAIIVTLLAGLVYTSAFAAAAVGSLNMISVAFAVLFIGIGVDFGIQVTMRYRAELFEVTSGATPPTAREAQQVALHRAALAISPPLGLAAIATCAGFFSFLPTDYQGVSELGLIAGTSMIIALLANLTILPAMLSVLPSRGRPEATGFAWAAPLDVWLRQRARTVVIAALVVGTAAALSIPWVRFDADPLDLKDPARESVSTALELTRDTMTSPYTIEILRPNEAAAEALAAQLSKLPLVKQALTLSSFVPDDQPEKLDTLSTTQMLMGPVVEHAISVPPPTPAQQMTSLKIFDAHLHTVMTGPHAKELGAPGAALLKALDAFLANPSNAAADLGTLQAALLGGFEARIDMLRSALKAPPLTLDGIPPDIKRDWIAADGRARVSVFPTGNMHDEKQLRDFVAAVRAVAPDATGSPITILESGNTVSNAFLTASLLALASITVILGLALRHWRDLIAVMVPLVLAGLYAMGSCVLLGIAFNYANVIAVPLLMGIGVAFDIYFVMAWRRGDYAVPALLQTSTARAVTFSACTTATAFGTLSLSHHVGTASMGILLILTLGYVLLCTLIIQPALMTLFSRKA